jgi:hypothetical protein
MKKMAFVLSVALAAGVASAQDAKKTSEAPKPAAHAAKVVAAKPATMAGEIVSVDAAKNTLTFKNAKGESVTWPAEGKALLGLKSVKAGDKVTIAYRANEKGEPQAATEISAAAPVKASQKATPAPAKPVQTAAK